MSAHEMHAAENLREVLEQLIKQCAMRVHLLDRYVLGWGEDAPKEKRDMMNSIDRLLKAAERAQKILTSMRKDRAAEESCRASCEGGACETFLAAIVVIEKELGPGRDIAEGRALPEPAGREADAGAGQERRGEEEVRSETTPPESRAPVEPEARAADGEDGDEA